MFRKKAWEEMIRKNQDILQRAIHNMDMATKVKIDRRWYDKNLAAAIGAMNNVLNGTMHYLYEEKELTPKGCLDKFYVSYCGNDKAGELCDTCQFSMDGGFCSLKKMQNQLEKEEAKENPDELVECVAMFRTLRQACEFVVGLPENSVISFTTSDGGKGGWRVEYYK